MPRGIGPEVALDTGYPQKVDRLPKLDAMRVLGIVAVIGVIHSQSYIEAAAGTSLRDVPGWELTAGALALGPVTFVAGYAARLSHEHLARRERNVGRQFLKRRLVRLYPLYLLAFCLFAALWYRDMSPEWIAMQVLGVGILVSRVAPPLLTTLYYVQLVMMFYAVFAVVMTVKATRWRLSAIVAGFVVCAVIATLVGNTRLAIYYPCFFLGVVAGRQLAAPAKPITYPLAFAVLAGMIAVLTIVPMSGTLSGLLRAIVGISSVVVFGPIAAWVARRLSATALKALSYGSFCAYLLHRPLYQLLLYLIGSHGIYWAVLTFVALGTALAFVVGYGLQRCYDALLGLMAVLRLRRQPPENRREQPGGGPE